jgi:hypothetical protein
MSTRDWSQSEIEDIQNYRGFGVSWQRIASYYGVSIEDVQRAVGEPQWRDAPASSSDTEPDLFGGFDRLQEVL